MPLVVDFAKVPVFIGVGPHTGDVEPFPQVRKLRFRLLQKNPGRFVDLLEGPVLEGAGRVGFPNSLIQHPQRRAAALDLLDAAGYLVPDFRGRFVVRQGLAAVSLQRLDEQAQGRELRPALSGDPVILATAAGLRFFPSRFNVAESFEPMENRVKHPVRPLHVPSGQFLNPLDDGVAIAVPFRQDRQNYRRRGSGYQVFVEFHDFTRRALSMGSNVAMHSTIIHNSSMYVKSRLYVFFEHGEGIEPPE